MAMKNFIDLEPRAWLNLYSIFLSMAPVSPNPSSDPSAIPNRDEIISAIASSLSSDFPPEIASDIALRAYNSFVSPNIASDFSSSADSAFITATDLSILRSLAAMGESEDSLSLLTSFCICAYENPHPSGWIHYDRKVVMHLASLSARSEKSRRTLTEHLHSSFNLGFRVVGSKNPIPCFSLPWHNSPDYDPTPFRIGPLSPVSVSSFVASLFPSSSSSDTAQSQS